MIISQQKLYYYVLHLCAFIINVQHREILSAILLYIIFSYMQI